MEHSGKYRLHCSRFTGRLQGPGHLPDYLRFAECHRMKTRSDIEQMSRNIIARQCVNVVAQFARATRRRAFGNGLDKFLQLANAHFRVIGNRVNLGPVACGKDHPATGMHRQPAEVDLERVRGN